jgi:hypothetical protein
MFKLNNYIVICFTETKEAAFNYALVTAGIVHVMARNCMKGDLPSCHCSRAKRPQSLSAKHNWGGCGDNIQYASDFSKTFLDDPKVLEKLNGSTNAKRAEKLLMDHHNKEAGRQVRKTKNIIFFTYSIVILREKQSVQIN